MTSQNRTDEQRVAHARRVLAEASGNMLTADWGTLYWIAQQVPQLLDVIDHLLPGAKTPKVLPGNDNGRPILELHLPEKPCGCGVLLGEKCDCNEFVSPQTWGWTR